MRNRLKRELLALYAIATLVIIFPLYGHAATRSYMDAGTYTFTVPEYDTLTVTVKGGGGGGGALDWWPHGYPVVAEAFSGEASTFNGTVVGYGGGGGNGCYYLFANTGNPGHDGAASGGDQHVVGGGGAGGYGAWATPQNYNCAKGPVTSRPLNVYRSAQEQKTAPHMNKSNRNVHTYANQPTYGGAGGAAVKTYVKGDLAPGTQIPVIVGRGGAGEAAITPGAYCAWIYGLYGCYSGYDGEPGSVTISWNVDVDDSDDDATDTSTSENDNADINSTDDNGDAGSTSDTQDATSVTTNLSYVAGTAADGSALTGHLQVRPSLIRSGSQVRVYWNIAGASSCTVDENNPTITDTWKETSSGAAGKLTSAIMRSTTYTLYCAATDGSTITESATVRLVPRFGEQ